MAWRTATRETFGSAWGWMLQLDCHDWGSETNREKLQARASRHTCQLTADIFLRRLIHDRHTHEVISFDWPQRISYYWKQLSSHPRPRASNRGKYGLAIRAFILLKFIGPRSRPHAPRSRAPPPLTPALGGAAAQSSFILACRLRSSEVIRAQDKDQEWC